MPMPKRGGKAVRGGGRLAAYSAENFYGFVIQNSAVADVISDISYVQMQSLFDPFFPPGRYTLGIRFTPTLPPRTTFLGSARCRRHTSCSPRRTTILRSQLNPLSR
jgi:hypothetical protein